MNSTRPEQEQALEETMGQFPPAAELAIAEEFCTPEPQETGVRRQPIQASLWQAFQQKAAGQGVTAFPVLLTLVGKAIGQYTDQSNVVLNVPRTARMVPIDGIFQAVGMYSDFSLVLVDAAGSDVFAQAKTLSISLMEQQFQGQISGLDRLKAWKKSAPQAAAPFVCTSLVDGAYDSRLFTRRFVRTQTAQGVAGTAPAPLRRDGDFGGRLPAKSIPSGGGGADFVRRGGGHGTAGAPGNGNTGTSRPAPPAQPDRPADRTIFHLPRPPLPAVEQGTADLWRNGRPGRPSSASGCGRLA